MADNPAASPPRHRYARLPLAAAALALIVGYLIGTDAPANGVVTTRLDLKDRLLIPVGITPPAVAVDRDGWTVVGAADDRYYVVHQDGSAIEVMVDRRHKLFWR